MKHIFLLLSALFCCLLASGQENFLPGYIVSNEGDTIHGTIDYRDWDKNPGSFRFKDPGQGTEITYAPGSIRGFFVAGNLYHSAAVDVEISPYKTNDLNFDPALFIIRDTVFLQVIIDGEKGLAYLEPASGKQQFYISQYGEYDLLIFKQYYSGTDNASSTAARVVSSNNKYVGQLTLFLTNCPGIQEKLYSVDYKWRDLQKLFDHYYDCTNMEKLYEGKIQKVTIEWSIIAGPSASFVRFTNNSGDDEYWEALENGDFSPSYFVAAGAGLDAVFPGGQGKWSFNNEIILTSYKVEGYYEDIRNEDYYIRTDMEIGCTYLKVNTMGRFKYPAGKSFLFANAGISNGFMIANTNYAKSEKQFYSSYEVTEGKAIEAMRNYEFGFLGGLGVRIGHFSGEIRYEMSTGMSPYTLLTSRVQRGFLLVGYRF